MWMTREEIAAALGIVPNSVRGKVQKGQIERKVEDGKNLYRIVSAVPKKGVAPQEPEMEIETAPPPAPAPPEPPKREEPKPVPRIVHQSHEPIRKPVTTPEPEIRRKPSDKEPFNPKQVLLEIIASLKIGRNIDAIEKGDEIDLATGEISRELDARISMRQHRQLKEIEDALERIKLGEYGTCEDCGEPIPEQRLRLFPAARLCVRCQEEMDQLEKLRESQGVRGGTWREEPADGTYVRSFED